MTDAQNDRDTGDSPRPPRNVAEWTTFGIASVVVAAIVGLIVYAWATEKNQPPILEVNQTGTIREINQQFYVPFEVTNRGGKTVESVRVLAELEVNGRVEANGEQEIDFLSRNETEEGAFVFQQDPRHGELTLRVGSYKKP